MHHDICVFYISCIEIILPILTMYSLVDLFQIIYCKDLSVSLWLDMYVAETTDIRCLLRRCYSEGDLFQRLPVVMWVTYAKPGYLYDFTVIPNQRSSHIWALPNYSPFATWGYPFYSIFFLTWNSDHKQYKRTALWIPYTLVTWN